MMKSRQTWRAAIGTPSLLPAAVLSFLTFSGRAQADSSTKTLCGQYDTEETNSGRYTLNTNVWGLDDSGAQCMTVNLDDSNNATSWSVEWQWAAEGANRTSVHAFPYMSLNSDSLPAEIGNITNLTLSGKWSYAASDPAVQMDTLDVLANVALDMFLDVDPNKSVNATEASHEVIIWQAVYGGMEPLGWNNTTPDAATIDMDGETYTLYTGKNTVGQNVHSWYPSENVFESNLNIEPFLRYLYENGLLTTGTYLGLAQFGTEEMHSPAQNLTFTATDVVMDIIAPESDSLSSKPGNNAGSRIAPAAALYSLAALAFFFMSC